MLSMLLLALVCSVLAVPVWAQSATVAVFASTVTDPNTSAPITQPVTYTPTCGVTPKYAQALPIVNPTLGAYDDPADASRDCRLTVTTQMAALSPASGYRAALKIGAGRYGAFSTAFAVSAAQPTLHPCDTTPVSLTTALVGQTVTFGWCHSGLNTAGAPTTITGWRVYRNGVVVTQTVTAGATLNAAGLRSYSTTRTEPAAGAVSLEVSALNATGESARTPAMAFTITQPATVPVVPTRTRIQ